MAMFSAEGDMGGGGLTASTISKDSPYPYFLGPPVPPPDMTPEPEPEPGQIIARHWLDESDWS